MNRGIKRLCFFCFWPFYICLCSLHSFAHNNIDDSKENMGLQIIERESRQAKGNITALPSTRRLNEALGEFLGANNALEVEQINNEFFNSVLENPSQIFCLSPGTRTPKNIVYFAFGNHDDIPLEEAFAGIKTAAEELNQRSSLVCFSGVQNQESLTAIFNNPHLSAFIYQGHGQDGDISSTKSTDAQSPGFQCGRIDPHSIALNPNSPNNGIQLLLFNSCYAGIKSEEWNQLAPNAFVVASNNSVTIDTANDLNRNISRILNSRNLYGLNEQGFWNSSNGIRSPEDVLFHLNPPLKIGVPKN